MPSSIKILDIGYGVLNPSFNSYAKNNYDTEEAGFFDLVKKTVDNSMGFNEHEGQGPMLGICLRIEGRTNQNGSTGPTDWFALTKAAGENAGVDMPELIQIKVRIPELHASIPVPNDLPDRFTTSVDHAIINMYPTFTAQSVSVNPPEPGTLVWVDFQNRETLEGGIFITPVDPTATIPVTLPAQSARSAHREAARRVDPILPNPASPTGTPPGQPQPGQPQPGQPNPPLPPLPNPNPNPQITGKWTSLDLNSQQGPGYYVKQTTWDRKSGVGSRQGKGREATSPLWGQEKVIATILEICARYATQSSAPGSVAGRLVLGDISPRYGGRAIGHGSHQTGEDVDIGIPVNTLYGTGPLATNWANYAGTAFGKTGPDGQQIAINQVAVRETETLLDVLQTFCDPQTTPAGLVSIEYIFISKEVSKKLFVTAGGVGGHLDINKYPASQTGLKKRDKRFNRKISYEPNHNDHIHVRFSTPWQKDKAPGGQPLPPVGDPYWS